MSQDSDQEEPAGTPVALNASVDAVTSLIIAAVGIVVIWQARKLGAGWSSDGPGAGYFPFYIGLVLTISSAVIFVQSLRKRSTSDVFVDSVQLRRVLQVLVPSAIYVGVIWVLGLYLASALFITLFMIVLGKYPPIKSITVGVAVNVLFFLMFEVWFKVPLFKGALDPLRFLGY
jgi:Tripartite tricarboxylate transporter TctB family